jgi:hypothetical protein
MLLQFEENNADISYTSKLKYINSNQIFVPCKKKSGWGVAPTILVAG